MNIFCAPITSVHDTAAHSRFAFLNGTYVMGISPGVADGVTGTSWSVKLDPPILLR
jgi:hypothetical protein